MAGINGFGNNFNNNVRKLSLGNNNLNSIKKVNVQPLSLTPKTVGDSFNKSLTPETKDCNDEIGYQNLTKSFGEIWMENWSKFYHSDRIGSSEMLAARYRDNEQMAVFDLLYVTGKSIRDWWRS